MGEPHQEMVKQATGKVIYDTAKAVLSTRNLPNGLTEEEQVALYASTMDTGNNALYMSINAALRTGKGIDELEPIISCIYSALKTLPIFEGIGYRSVKDTPMGKEAYQVFMDEHSVGKIVTYDGFTATSIDADKVLRGKLVYGMD